MSRPRAVTKKKPVPPRPAGPKTSKDLAGHCLQLASIHEAGHAVAAHALGMRVHQIAVGVWPHESGRPMFGFCDLDQWPSVGAYVIMRLAGPGAVGKVQKNQPPQTRRSLGFENDLAAVEDVWRRLRLQGEVGHGWLMEKWRRTQRLVSEEWPAVLKIARILRRRHRLGETQVCRLLAGVPAEALRSSGADTLDTLDTLRSSGQTGPAPMGGATSPTRTAPPLGRPCRACSAM